MFLIEQRDRDGGHDASGSIGWLMGCCVYVAGLGCGCQLCVCVHTHTEMGCVWHMGWGIGMCSEMQYRCMCSTVTCNTCGIGGAWDGVCDISVNYCATFEFVCTILSVINN